MVKFTFRAVFDAGGNHFRSYIKHKSCFIWWCRSNFWRYGGSKCWSRPLTQDLAPKEVTLRESIDAEWPDVGERHTQSKPLFLFWLCQLCEFWSAYSKKESRFKLASEQIKLVHFTVQPHLLVYKDLFYFQFHTKWKNELRKTLLNKSNLRVMLIIINS